MLTDHGHGLPTLVVCSSDSEAEQIGRAGGDLSRKQREKWTARSERRVVGLIEHLAIQVVMPRRLHLFSLCLFRSSLRLEFTFLILSWLGGFCSDGADGCEVQVLNEEGLWADGQVRQKFLHVCVPQVVCLPPVFPSLTLSSSVLQ